MGYLRLALAWAVVLNHLSWEQGKFAGPIAVFGFYTVSGYLVVGAIARSYASRPFAFLVNRALRIYPSYWLLVIVGWGIALFGSPLNPAMALPTTSEGWLRQIAILGLLNPDGGHYPFRLVPPAWSVSIELFWYFAMLLLWRYTAVWLVTTAAASLVYWVHGGWEAAYYNYLAPGVCFALGGFCSQYKLKLPHWHIAPAAALLASIFVAGNYAPPSSWLMHSSALATAYLLVALPAARDIGAARLAGELAYPVFLCHWAVASIIGQGVGLASLAANATAIALFSLLIVFGVERPIAHLRDAIRARA